LVCQSAMCVDDLNGNVAQKNTFLNMFKNVFFELIN